MQTALAKRIDELVDLGWEPVTKKAPDGRVKFSGGSVAAGIGYTWGSGTLTYKWDLGDPPPKQHAGSYLDERGLRGTVEDSEHP